MSNETDKWFRNAQDRTPGTPGGEEQLYRDEMSKMYENMRGNGGNTPKQQPVQNPKVKSVRKASSGKGGGLIGAFCFAAVVIGVINSCDDKPQYRPKAQEPSTYTAPTSMVNPYKSNQEAEKPKQQPVARAQPTEVINPYKSSGEQKEQPVKREQPTEVVNPYKTNKAREEVIRVGHDSDEFKAGSFKDFKYMDEMYFSSVQRLVYKGGAHVDEFKRAVDNLNINVVAERSGDSLLHGVLKVLDFDYDKGKLADVEEAVKYLLDKGIDVNIIDKYGNTAFDELHSHYWAFSEDAKCMDQALVNRLIPRRGFNQKYKKKFTDTVCAKAYNYEF